MLIIINFCVIVDSRHLFMHISLQNLFILFCISPSLHYLCNGRNIGLNMRQHKTLTLILATAMLTGWTACEKEKFDQDIYNQYVDYEFMIDNMDRTHDWKLTKSDEVTVLTSGYVLEVQVLTDNIYTSNTAEVAAQGVCYDNKATLGYSIPISQEQLYLGVIGMDGSYMGVVPFKYGTKTIDLTTSTFEQGSQITNPTAQTFTYLFEDNFPEPGDFDYNDLVLRVSKGYDNVSYNIYLTVKVEAVGTAKQIAAAIHLGGVQYDDITQVELVSNEKLDEGYPLPRNFINSNELLLRGRNGEAVLNLFEDAHWSLLKNRDDNGSIMRMRLNTSRDETEGFTAKANPQSVTYLISFKSREKARSLTFDNIDPFILEEYNGSIWEIHTYYYKFNDVLKNIFRGNASLYDNHISWCVTVPQSDFRYPVEGMSIGTYNSETEGVYGPYDGFAYWIQNHISNTDWYKHPTRPQLLY